MGELTEAIDKVLKLDQTIVVHQIDGRLYSKNGLSRIQHSNEYIPECVSFNTLTGISGFAESLSPPVECDENHLFFLVKSPTEVSLCGALQSENMNRRFMYANSVTDFTPFDFSTKGLQNWIDIELFVISLQSLFIETDMRESIIDMLGKVSNENVETQEDNGFSQSLQIRNGISNREKVEVKNPVTLKPYRTFREVDQPEGSFILRFRSRSGIECSLWEADGGLWKDAAMRNIKQWLSENTEIPVLA